MNIELVKLKIKIKTLAEEARIIRKEEKRIKDGKEENKYHINDLHLHRVGVVRRCARETHLAYAYLRGFSYSDIEKSAKRKPNWDAVAKMVAKYGTIEQNKEFQKWISEPAEKIAA